MLEQDTYWQEDIPLFEGMFSYFRSQNTPRPVQIRAKIHTSQEQYIDGNTEIVPLAPHSGERTYVMMQPYVEEPNIGSIFPLHGSLPYKDFPWRRLATIDRAQIKTEWPEPPGANVGVPIGEVSGVIFLDRDVPEGYFSLKTWQERHKNLLATRTARTAHQLSSSLLSGVALEAVNVYSAS